MPQKPVTLALSAVEYALRMALRLPRSDEKLIIVDQLTQAAELLDADDARETKIERSRKPGHKPKSGKSSKLAKPRKRT